MASLRYTYHRVFKYAQLLAIALGATISSTYFLGNGFLLHQLGPFAFLSYVAGGLITYLVMNSMAELAGNENPTHLSFIEYSYNHLSPSFSCAVGYTYWINWLITIPIECISGGFLLNALTPQVPIFIYATLIALAIFVLNSSYAKKFSKAQELFTYTHLAIFAIFIIVAALIFLGFVGNQKDFLGAKFLLRETGAFPNGFKVFMFNSVIMLLNFQGAEVIGLAASETKDAKQQVPETLREMAPAVSILYVLPMLLIALIYPWDNPVMEGSVFSRALESYGFTGFGTIFALLIVCGSVAVCNSGLYASTRCAHAMAHFKMLPSYFIHLSKKNVPYRLTVISSMSVFLIIVSAVLFPHSRYYDVLLSLSAFTGCISWIAICLAQIQVRKRMKKKEVLLLNYRDYLFPLGPYLAIFFMLFSMFIIFLDKTQQPAAFIGVSFFIISYLGFKLKLKLKPLS